MVSRTGPLNLVVGKTNPDNRNETSMTYNRNVRITTGTKQLCVTVDKDEFNTASLPTTVSIYLR